MSWDKEKKAYKPLRCPDPPDSIKRIDQVTNFLIKKGYDPNDPNRSDRLNILTLVLKLLWYLYPTHWVGCIIFTILSSVASVCSPKVFQELIDIVVSSSGKVRLDDLWIYILLLAAISAFVRLCDFFSDKINFYVATQFEDLSRYTAFQNVMHQDLSWYDQQSTGNIMGGLYAPSYDIVRVVFSNQMIGRSLKFVFVVGMILFYERHMVWLFIPLPIYFFATNHFLKKIKLINPEVHSLWEASDTTINDAIGHIRTVKVFSREESELNRYAVVWNSRHVLEYDQNRLGTRIVSIQQTVEVIMRALVLAYFIKGMENGSMTLGSLSMMLSYFEMLLSPLEWFSGLGDSLNRWSLKLSKQMDLITMSSTQKSQNIQKSNKSNTNGKSQELVLPSLKKAITFSNVCFSYDPARNLALNKVSFSLPRGKTTAFVGRSGAGKTTITSLLLRFYDPLSGVIEWDGTDVTKVTNTAVRKAVALVPQDPALFNRTIAENISYGKPNATQEEIEKAAKDAYAHDFIMETPDGYLSLVGENGIKLSGGQKQRIAIARALILNPSVLILDESTSQLDSESEKAIQTYIDQTHPDRAQLIIAHRLSTIRHAHNIIVLNEGEVIAQGTYEELLNTCCLFNNFHNLQANALKTKTAHPI